MTQARFVLRYRGEGAAPVTDITAVHGLAGAVVVDASSRMLLVEADADRLRRLVETLPGWVMAAEQAYAVPDTRKQVEEPPR